MIRGSNSVEAATSSVLLAAVVGLSGQLETSAALVEMVDLALDHLLAGQESIRLLEGQESCLVPMDQLEDVVLDMDCKGVLHRQSLHLLVVVVLVVLCRHPAFDGSAVELDDIVHAALVDMVENHLRNF